MNFPTLQPCWCSHQYTTHKKQVAEGYRYATDALLNGQDGGWQEERTAVGKPGRLTTFPNLNIRFLKRPLFWLQSGDYGGRTGLVFLQFHPQSIRKMLLIDIFYKSVTFWKTRTNAALFGGYRPKAKTLSKALHSSLRADLSKVTILEGHR